MAQCLHPRYIKTFLGFRKVDCGRCASCLNKKGIRNSCYVDLEHQSSSSQFFFTLTYANYFLPIVRVDYSPECECYFANPYNKRLIEDNYGASLYSWRASEFNGHDDKVWDHISKKTKLPKRFVPVIYIRDVQLFMKRLKINLIRTFKISTDYVEQIRYYYCAEYGTKHFRPHFHFLLFIPENIRPFLSSELLREAVCSSWTFGIIDWQRSKGKNSSYLAEYLNSASSLTSFHCLKFFRQRSRHSNYFAESYFPSTPEGVLSNGSAFFAPSAYVHGGKLKSCLPPSSIERRLFPKCLRYRLLLPEQILSVYLSFEDALSECSPRWYGPEKLACEILYNRSRSLVLDRLYKIYGHQILDERTLYGVFLCSYKFLKLCKQFDYQPFEYLDLIRKFYDNKEIALLRSQYEAQDSFVRKYVQDCNTPENIYFLSNFYDNFIFDEEKRDFPSRKYVSSLIEREFLFNLNYGLNLCDVITYEEIHYRKNPMYIEESQKSLQLHCDKIKHKEDITSDDVDYIIDNFKEKFDLWQT